MGNRGAPGRVGGPVRPAQHAGLGRSTCPPRQLPPPVRLLHFVLSFSFSLATFEDPFLCVCFCQPVQLSLAPFSVPDPDQEDLKVSGEGSWLAGWLAGLRRRTAGLAGAERARGPGKYTPPPRARAFAGKHEPQNFWFPLGSLSVWTSSGTRLPVAGVIQAPGEKTSVSFWLQTQRPWTLLPGGQGCTR